MSGGRPGRRPGGPQRMAPSEQLRGHGSFSCEGCVPDSVDQVRNVRELYELAGRRELAAPEVDLYPEALRPAIDSVNEWVAAAGGAGGGGIQAVKGRAAARVAINNGVYRCGFAQKQEAYDNGLHGASVRLQRCEELLSRQRYLTGATFTEADLRLFIDAHPVRPSLTSSTSRTNWDMLRHYPALSNYTRELFQMPAIRRAIDIRHIKVHYFTSHPTLNYYAIVPKGGPAWWEEPHNRDALFPRP
ncbi:hypothetical protein QJQ45_012167 [Haematococcus lacustris]|nr:hypothetical protein QJQ45_012167 [Haematococcus lacustris]